MEFMWAMLVLCDLCLTWWVIWAHFRLMRVFARFERMAEELEESRAMVSHLEKSKIEQASKDQHQCLGTVLRLSTGYRVSRENPSRINFDSAWLHRADDEHRSIVKTAFHPFDPQFDLKSNAKSGRHPEVSTWGLIFSKESIAQHVLQTLYSLKRPKHHISSKEL